VGTAEQDTHEDRTVYDEAVDAAKPVWVENGHDLLAALWRVASDHPDRAVRVAAREAFSRCRDVRWVRQHIEQRFGQES
jgi:hypothetical protein